MSSYFGGDASSNVLQTNITVIVLTFNEEIHLRRCLSSIETLGARAVIVDSGSNDGTCDIATNMGADVFVHPFVNYATQFNWALDNANIQTDWVMRLDADEVVTPELVQAMKSVLPHTSLEISGYTINLRRIFFHKWLRYGALYPIRLLRIWRNNHGRCETRWMDEHIKVQGDVKHIDADFADYNLNNITWWTNKHNQYATREAIDLIMLEMQDGDSSEDATNMNKNAQIKRWIKKNVYSRLPLGVRSFSYFFYRYFLRLGFLDGWPGLVFHVLQGFWYRFLVDVKVYELRQLMEERGQSLAEVVKTEYGYDILA